MTVTVLYSENIYPDDSVERRIYGPDVRVIFPASSEVPGRPVRCGLRRGRGADDPALQGHRRRSGPFPPAARDLPDGRRLRQPRPQGRGRTADHDPQRARLRHHRGRRSRDRAGAGAAPRAAAAPGSAAQGSAGGVALYPRSAGAPLRRADVRHRRPGPHRHRGRAARQGVRLPRGVLRSEPAERRGAGRRRRPRARRWRTCCARPTRCRCTRR